MSKIVDNLLYTKTHEWVKIEDNIAIVGVTDFAQKNLDSVVYVEAFLDEEVNKNEECGAIESVKSASDLYAPVTGTVIEFNENVADHPELINEDPYGNWILKIEFADETELNDLLNCEDYEKVCLDEEL